MSKLDLTQQIRLNVISKQDITLRISIIVGSTLFLLFRWFDHLTFKTENRNII